MTSILVLQRKEMARAGSGRFRKPDHRRLGVAL